MNRYVFGFGYSTPAQLKANGEHGWDDELSNAIVISANTPEEALLWGRELAELFFRRLFEDAGCQNIPSWNSLGYASWIEPLPSRTYDESVLERLPHVFVNELPDFARW